MNCKRCQETPGFHSFTLIAQKSDIHFFYCYPAHNKQSVRTREDMLNFVSHFPTDIKWSLLFHAKDYGMSHMMPISVALEMGKLIQQNRSLQKIFILDGHWFMTFLLRCIFPFLEKEMREKCILIEGSILEVTARLREEGLSVHDLQMLRNNS